LSAWQWVFGARRIAARQSQGEAENSSGVSSPL
jgi:hypothetical protein